MEKGSRTLVTIAIAILVALGAYGLGFVTPFLTGQAQTTTNANASATPGSSADSGGQSTLPKPNLPGNSQDINQQFDSFWKTFEDVNSEFYYQPIDRQKMIYGAAKGMMQALGDDFSAFETPQENEAIQSSMQGNFEGV